jgi:hypothetical protein
MRMHDEIFPFGVRRPMLNTRMHFCMNILYPCSEIDCVCEQTEQTFVSLKYSINTFPLHHSPLRLLALFFSQKLVLQLFYRFKWKIS